MIMVQSAPATDIQQLIQEGNAALRAGDTLTAQKYFRRATELDPEKSTAWVGMARSVRAFREKQEYLQRALALDPSNAEIQASLAYVEEQLAAGEVLAPKLKPEVTDEDVQSSSVETEVLYCYRHPDRETGLRCTQCGNPICPDCVRPAFVGQLCPDCARERRPRNYQVDVNTLLVAASITLAISSLINLLGIFFLGGFFFGFIIAFVLAPIAAEMIVRVLDRITQAKRGRAMQITTGFSYGLGLVLPTLLISLGTGIPLQFGFSLISLPLMFFTVVAIVTLVGRLR
jgi:tetratricopeptide (TPR) repeat protein